MLLLRAQKLIQFTGALLMVRHFLLFSVVLGLVAAGGTVRAQVVMLPTQQQFRYNGSVLVPDGGSVYLGGNSRYATSRSRRGLIPWSSSRGSTIGSGGLSISATIIDHQEIDRQLLGGSPEEFLRRERAREQNVATRRDAIQRDAVVPPSHPNHQAPVLTANASVEASASVEEGKALVRYARRLYAEGDVERSKAAYRLAFPLLDEQLRKLAVAEFNQVATLPPADAAL